MAKKPSRLPDRVRASGRTYTRRLDGRYQDNSGSILSDMMLWSIMSPSEQRDCGGSDTSSGGGYSSGGYSSGYDSSGGSSGGYDSGGGGGGE